MRYVETVQVSVDELQPFPGNARVHDRVMLAESARTNGQYRSIVARRRPDGALEILAGHGTRDAFAETGARTVRVEVIDADDDEARRIVLVDNRANDVAQYDDAALLDLLADLDGQFIGTGYDAGFLDALLAAQQPSGELFEPTEDEIRLDSLTPRLCPNCGYDVANDPDSKA